mmetsp:Transcript_18490/g.25071  ORF Transcript_18490/g.25071 Transcript_18490/m.25071 type:complete len:240 (-) Transcript_18490:1429-2148(-)
MLVVRVLRCLRRSIHTRPSPTLFPIAMTHSSVARCPPFLSGIAASTTPTTSGVTILRSVRPIVGTLGVCSTTLAFASALPPATVSAHPVACSALATGTSVADSSTLPTRSWTTEFAWLIPPLTASPTPRWRVGGHVRRCVRGRRIDCVVCRETVSGQLLYAQVTVRVGIVVPVPTLQCHIGRIERCTTIGERNFLGRWTHMREFLIMERGPARGVKLTLLWHHGGVVRRDPPMRHLHRY